MKKNIIGTIMIVACIGLAVLINPIDTNAQGNLRYQNRYSKADVGRIISKLESSSNTFRHDFDKAMDKSRYNGTREEDQFNATVKDYENSLDRLRNRFDRNDSWWEARNEVSDMLRYAQPVNTMMNSISFRRNIERQWNAMRNDINTLADTFDLPGLNGGGWNGGNNGGGWEGGGTRPPNWAIGTFYATNGPNITLTINVNGRVTVINDGQTYYGTYNNGILIVNGDQSTVSELGGGLSTYNRNTGQRTIYSRSGGANPGGGWGGSGPIGTPPSWAQGTFYSTDGSNITLTIDSSGRATVLNGGQTYYGNYYRGDLSVNGDVSTVSRSGNGIRTYNRNTRQTTVYSRTGGGWGNNPGAGGGNTSTPPNWAVGSFYSTNGTNIQLTINGNGQVTAIVNGMTYYGTYYNGAITLNGDVSTVTRNGNGIRTYNTNNRETTNYRRN